MSATYREVRRYLSQPITVNHLLAASEKCGFRVVTSSDQSVDLSARISWWSFGENIQLRVAELDNDGVLDITSSCKSATTIEDWGKNRKNVSRLFAAVEAQLGPNALGLPVEFCASCGYLLLGAPAGACPECGSRATQAAAPGWSFKDRVRRAVLFAIALTAVEVIIIFLLRLCQVDPGPRAAYTGRRGLLNVLLFNLFIIAVILVVARPRKR